MEFAFAQASVVYVTAMVTKKGVIGLLRRILTENVWKPHLLNQNGKRLPIKDVSVREIIHSITTESVKHGSQDTQDSLKKRQ